MMSFIRSYYVIESGAGGRWTPKEDDEDEDEDEDEDKRTTNGWEGGEDNDDDDDEVEKKTSIRQGDRGIECGRMASRRRPLVEVVVSSKANEDK